MDSDQIGAATLHLGKLNTDLWRYVGLSRVTLKDVLTTLITRRTYEIDK